MIQIRTSPMHTHPPRASTELSRMSSMRAALNSKYCMRAQILARRYGGNLATEQDNAEFFSYQEGQHRVVSNGQKTVNGNGKLHLPEEVKITKTKNGKCWRTSSMEVELAKDILEVRDSLGKVVDALVFKNSPRQHPKNNQPESQQVKFS